MKLFLTYFVLEYKKSIKVLGKSIVGMVLMFAVLIAGVAAVSHTILQSQAVQKVEVAVVIPKEEKQVRLVAQYISNMDSVKSICNFRYMDEENAWNELENGNIQAIIDFPENFYEDVYVGRNTPADIYFSKQETLNAGVFQGLLTAGVSFLQTSEAGVYASLGVAHEYPTQIPVEEIGDYIAALYAKEIMNRGDVFEKEILSAIGTVDYNQYYFSAGVLLILLMSGLNYGYLYRKRNKALEQKLYIYGLGKWKTSLVKILIMSGILWSIGMIIYLAGCAFEVLFFDSAVIPGMFLLCISIAVYFHIIYLIAGSSLRGTVFLLLVNLIMILCSGLVIPTAYFPELWGNIGKWMPLNLWSRYHIQMILGELQKVEIGKILGFIALETGIGVAVLWKED